VPRGSFFRMDALASIIHFAGSRVKMSGSNLVLPKMRILMCSIAGHLFNQCSTVSVLTTVAPWTHIFDSFVKFVLIIIHQGMVPRSESGEMNLIFSILDLHFVSAMIVGPIVISMIRLSPLSVGGSSNTEWLM
jgi:hypothetical protein